MRNAKVLIYGALLAMLTACGSSNDGGGNPTVPQGDSFVSYTGQLAESTPEDSEASDIDAIVETTPEDAEPEDIG